MRLEVDLTVFKGLFDEPIRQIREVGTGYMILFSDHRIAYHEGGIFFVHYGAGDISEYARIQPEFLKQDYYDHRNKLRQRNIQR